jgi:hypothetical protein
MMALDLLTDPTFWLAVLLWLGVLCFALALLTAGARDDRLIERSREDVADRQRQIGGWSK